VILRALGRLIVVPLAFVLAVVTAVGVLMTLGLERITHALSGSRGLDEGSVDVLFDIAHGAIGLAGAATVVPAILVVILGEVARIRSALFYVLGGGAALAVLPLLARAGSLGSGGMASLGTIWPVFATAGFAGGFVYWLIAGRNA
jgi:hypothetical protein